MVAEYLTCPLCGFEFAKQDTLCTHGCPLGALCLAVRCPSCEYEFPEKPRSVSWFGRLFRRAAPQAPELPEKVRTLDDLKLGERAEVLCLCRSPSRSSALSVFGIVPGAEVTVIQQRPACVVRVGETELALDRDIAGQVLVSAPLDEVHAR